MCNTSFLDSNIFATLVGGTIGFLSSIITTIWYSGRQAKIAKYNNYKAWCNGVKAEVNHLLKVIDEIGGILASGTPSTKRLNHDYLEQSRIKIIDFEDDLSFLEILTNAYRDIVHTNNMLDRLERDFVTHPTLIHNVISSINGVKNSVISLNKVVDDKIKKFTK